MTTRALAVACLAAREFDHEDPVLVRAMVGVLSNTLKKAVRRGELVRADSGREAVWAIRLAHDRRAAARGMRAAEDASGAR